VGFWTSQIADNSGYVTLTVEPATAVIIRFHAAAAMSAPSASTRAARWKSSPPTSRDGFGTAWQKADSNLIAEPNCRS